MAQPSKAFVEHRDEVRKEIFGEVVKYEEIDPRDTMFTNVPLWCVYGYDFCPQVMACKISRAHIEAAKAAGRDYVHMGPAILGYSVFKRQPGYRTLGQDLAHWLNSHETHKTAKFFISQREALAYLSDLLTPHPDALEGMKKAFRF